MFVTATASVYVDLTGAAEELVVVLTPAGALLPLIGYFRAEAVHRSASWQYKVAQGLILFLEYMNANPGEQNSQLLFQNFAQRLATGTFDLESHWDPSALCWQSRPPDFVRGVVYNLTNLFRHLKRDRPLSEQINPVYESNPFDRMIDQAAYQYRRDAAMLGYSWASGSPDKGRPAVRGARPPKIARGEPPAFPEHRFEELLVKGFVGARRPDFRGACVTLLLHGAGFRESEPFHLYVQDVFPDPHDQSSCCVHIHHPTWGEAPLDWRSEQGRPPNATRSNYLAMRYGLSSRSRLMSKLRAGWKEPLLDGPHYMQAYWFTEQYGRWFQELWGQYMKQLAGMPRSHPWAFVNLTRGAVGAPYKLSQFDKAHAAACERIGLQVAKGLGTTRHGHRHAYGQRLQEAGIDKAYIKMFMHHKSLESQATYTQPKQSQMRLALANGLTALAQRQSLPRESLLYTQGTPTDMGMLAQQFQPVKAGP